ncbi:ATP-binding protein [uncultured Desulfosarcina sp.]|uniref:ATP-binding protein n=1 Tax=uncultured Desulfosarcina sp. TaxID=218289 RepID=UPI0029C628E3|nr:ATP-binding protein [uncultured Desulfosarcina sp.]
MNDNPNEVSVAIPYSRLRVSLNPLTLAFTGSHKSLEQPFREAYFDNSLDHLRRCKLYATLFFGIFGILDALVFPELIRPLWFIRYALVCPIFLIGLVFSYTAAYRRVWQALNAFYIMLTGFAYVAMVVIIPPPESYFYGVGTIFCIFFGYTFIHARFITATVAGLLVLAGYQAAMFLLMETTGSVQLIFGAHFLGINLLGMLICYSIETQERKSFFLTTLLEKEKRKTEAANRNLEKRVEERTAALQRINRDLYKEVQERKQAEQRVRSSHSQLESVMDSIDNHIYVSDIDTRVILMANRHMKKTYGEDIVGKKCHDAIYRRDTICSECRNRQLLDKNDQPAESCTWEEKNPINDRWYLNYARAIVWEDRRIVQLRVATDITAMKEMESRLQRAQKMEAIGTLAGGVAHDLNNILSGLVGYPELLLMDAPEKGEARLLLETIKKSGEKAAAIVQDLLTLARRGVAVSKVIDLNRVVQDYLTSPEMANLQSIHPKVAIQTNLSARAFNIMGSGLHLEKTVMNLVTNAAEAMPEGGKITLTTCDRHVDRPIQGFETIPEGEYVVLTVADTGTGIPESDLERIFEPFYTNKQMGRSGTGLGMAVVWGTMKDHGGYIDARSTRGRGTEFDLYFPITRQDVTPETEARPMESYRGRGELVLIVDDIKEQRDLAAFMLKRLGYRVETVSSGREAVDFAKRQSVDILVLDMILEPDMDGLETYRQILAFSPGQKAIIASGFSESERVQEARELGAGAYIKKPYRMEQIGSALRQQLDENSNDESRTGDSDDN